MIKDKIVNLIVHLRKISLASACLIFMIVTIPLVEKDIDWLQGQKDKLVINTLMLEVINSHIYLETLIPDTPSTLISEYQKTLSENKPSVTKFWEATKIIDDYIDRLKLVKMALLIAPVIIFTLADIFRVENEPKIARYMIYIGIVTVIILLITREYIWSDLRSSLPPM